jgi:DNA-binding GntR family transcriptional regulator
VATAAALHRMSLLEQRHTTRSYILTPEWQAAHAAFHAALVAPCGSPILLGVRASLYARAERYRSLSAIYRKVKRNKTEEHKAIMQAAVARKTDKALSLIDSHIRSTTANVLQFAAEMLEATQ